MYDEPWDWLDCTEQEYWDRWSPGSCVVCGQVVPKTRGLCSRHALCYRKWKLKQ